ncbi:MAG TPA: PilZ domain-containing protein [Candidatus Aquicultor sp.]
MATVKSTIEATNNRVKEFLTQGASFCLRPEELDHVIYFSIEMAIDDDLFICRSKRKATLDIDLTDRAVEVIFAEDMNASSMKLIVYKQSSDGTLIAVCPVGTPKPLPQRKHRRLKPSESINFRIQANTTGNIYKGAFVDDISEGGIGVIAYANSEITVGTSVHLIIELQADEHIIIAGTIVNCSKYEQLSKAYRIGIRFVGASEGDLKKLAAFIHQQLKQPKPAGRQ